MEAVLIWHPEIGYILYDTGNAVDWESVYSEHIKSIYPISRLVYIKEVLAKENLTVDDIQILVISHLHFDHAGGLKAFSGTKAGKGVIVSKAELESASKCVADAPDGTAGAYIGKLFYQIPGIEFDPMCRKKELADGIMLFEQKCHTAGLIGMIVHLKNRTLLFTGDTVYLQDAYEKELPPGGNINKTATEFYDNLHFLKKMQEELNADVIYGHDYAQAQQWFSSGWIES